MLQWNLWEKKAAAPIERNQQSMFTYLYLVRRNRNERRHDADFDFDVPRFLAGDRSETWVLEGGSGGSFDNRPIKRVDWDDIADAAA